MAKKKSKKDELFKNYETINYDMDLGSDDEDLSELKKRLIFAREESVKKGYYEWFQQIASLIDVYYYALSLEEFTEIFNSRKGYHLSLADIRQASVEFLVLSMTAQARVIEEDRDPDELTAEEMGIYYIPVRSKKTGVEYLARNSAMNEEDLLDYHIELKKDHPVYIPTPEEAKDVWENYWPLHGKYPQKAIKDLNRVFGLARDKAEDIVYDLWISFAYNYDPIEKLQSFQTDYPETGINTVKDIQALSDIMMELYNHTNKMVNNGYSPDGLHERYVREGKYNTNIPPKIIPMSSMAAESLKKAGIPNVDYDASATNVPTLTMGSKEVLIQGNKKVYPNDPCPCGSGKKYKRCCGK